jgi:nucleoid-associated protein YgaU
MPGPPGPSRTRPSARSTRAGFSIDNRTIAEPTVNPGAFRFGSHSGGSYANFDLSGERITSYDQGGVAGGYTVRQGDTLETIAAQLWGDSALWYKLAQANGMSASNAAPS